MVSALAHVPPGAPLLPEDECVAWVENSAALDLDLLHMGDKLWADLGKDTDELNRALEQVECPLLILKSSFFPKPGAPQYLEEETSEKPNIKVIRFVNTGHLIHHEQFEQFIQVVLSFLVEH